MDELNEEDLRRFVQVGSVVWAIDQEAGEDLDAQAELAAEEWPRDAADLMKWWRAGRLEEIARVAERVRVRAQRILDTVERVRG